MSERPGSWNVRWIVALCVVFGAIAWYQSTVLFGPAVAPQRESHGYAFEQGRGSWRRTTHGWERIEISDAEQKGAGDNSPAPIPPSRAYAHPLVVALLLMTASLAALVLLPVGVQKPAAEHDTGPANNQPDRRTVPDRRVADRRRATAVQPQASFA